MTRARDEMALIGRRAEPIVVLDERDLGSDDLEALGAERGVQKPNPIAKIGARHHALARMIATGTPQGDAAICCGYTQSRVSILMSDPMFRELVSHYSGEVKREYLGMVGKMAALGEDTVDTIATRLEEDPEGFSNTELLSVATAMADRTGHGVSTKSEVNIRVGLAERMAEAAKRVAAERAGAIIEGTATEVKA